MRYGSLFIVSVIVVCGTFFSSNSMAERFTKDGYEIEILWKQQKDRLNVWGNVRGGKACQQLNLSLYFANSKDSGSGHAEAAIKNYRPSGRNNYKAMDEKVYVDKRARKHWHVDSIYINCL